MWGRLYNHPKLLWSTEASLLQFSHPFPAWSAAAHCADPGKNAKRASCLAKMSTLVLRDVESIKAAPESKLGCLGANSTGERTAAVA